MSSSMPIPRRKQSATSSPAFGLSPFPASGSTSSYNPTASASSSYSNHSSSPGSSSSSSPRPVPLSAKAKQKAPATSVVAESPPPDEIYARRPSLLGSSLSHSEYTVVNLGHSDGPPRLVTCVKSSQGFDWNQQLFLPSYADYDVLSLEHRSDPIQDIILTDEEAAAILPQW